MKFMKLDRIKSQKIKVKLYRLIMWQKNVVIAKCNYNIKTKYKIFKINK